jgi:hypothetical protein
VSCSSVLHYGTPGVFHGCMSFLQGDHGCVALLKLHRYVHLGHPPLTCVSCISSSTYRTFHKCFMHFSLFVNTVQMTQTMMNMRSDHCHGGHCRGCYEFKFYLEDTLIVSCTLTNMSLHGCPTFRHHRYRTFTSYGLHNTLLAAMHPLGPTTFSRPD